MLIASIRLCLVRREQVDAGLGEADRVEQQRIQRVGVAR